MLAWWDRSTPGELLTRLLGSGGSSLLFGFGYGVAPGFLAALFGGRLLAERPVANGLVAAGVVFLLATPVICNRRRSSGVIASWIAGTAAKDPVPACSARCAFDSGRLHRRQAEPAPGTIVAPLRAAVAGQRALSGLLSCRAGGGRSRAGPSRAPSRPDRATRSRSLRSSRSPDRSPARTARRPPSRSRSARRPDQVLRRERSVACRSHATKKKPQPGVRSRLWLTPPTPSRRRLGVHLHQLPDARRSHLAHDALVLHRSTQPQPCRPCSTRHRRPGRHLALARRQRRQALLDLPIFA